MRRLSRQAFVLYGLCILLLIIALILAYRIVRVTPGETIPNESAYTIVPVTLDKQALAGRIAVIQTDGAVSLLDPETEVLDTLPVPDNLFEQIYHFSASPELDAAYIIGTSGTISNYPFVYAYIDLHTQSLIWFDDAAFNHLDGGPYRIHDFVMDHDGRGFLFSLVSDIAPNTYTLASVDPARAHATIISSVSADELLLKYYSSIDHQIAYTMTVSNQDTSILETGKGSKREIGWIEAVSDRAAEATYVTYINDGSVVVSSFKNPEVELLRLKPDPVYQAIHPSVAASNAGSYMAYRARITEEREGVVTVVNRQGDIVFEQEISGQADLFFSPDERYLLVVGEESANTVLVADGTRKDLNIPDSIARVVGWY